MLTSVPAEISLQILQHLSIQDISRLSVVSRALREFLDLHGDAVYHHAAIHHRFIRANVKPDQLDQVIPRCFRRDGELSWQNLCRRQFLLERSWNAQGTVAESPLPLPPASEAFQLHVDEEYDVIFVNCRRHIIILTLEGLVVQVITFDGVSSISSASDGYLAFVNEAANAQPSILVYKKTPDTPEYRLLHELLPPEDLQFAVRDNALKSNALYLAVLLQAQHGVRVGVYNIVNGTLLYVINPTERLDGAWVPESGFNFASLDMTKTHVLISFLTCVMIVSFSALEFEEEKQRFIFPSRSMGMDAIQIMMAIPHRALEAQPPPDRWKARISPSIWKNASESTVYMDGSIALSPVTLCSPLVRLDVNSTSIVPWSDTMTEQRFMSAALSPSGRHFAAANEYGVLYIAANFDRVRKILSSWEAITTKIIFPPAVTQIIWNHEERLVVKAGGALYILNLNPNEHGMSHMGTVPNINSELPSFSSLKIHRVTHLADRQLRMAIGSTTAVTSFGIWTISTQQLWENRMQRSLTLLGTEQDDHALPASRDIIHIDFSLS